MVQNEPNQNSENEVTSAAMWLLVSLFPTNIPAGISDCTRLTHKDLLFAGSV